MSQTQQSTEKLSAKRQKQLRGLVAERTSSQESTLVKEAVEEQYPKEVAKKILAPLRDAKLEAAQAGDISNQFPTNPF